MLTVEKEIVESYSNFASCFGKYLNITTENAYDEAQEIASNIRIEIGRTKNHPLRPLFDILFTAIKHYEETDPEMIECIERMERTPSEIVMLRTLMESHDLNGGDFEKEIGKKSLVSQILSGKRELTKNHIRALSERFNIEPTMFFRS